ncbi:MAG: hypothetical protein V2I76_05770 [Roseobacter sp.]|jgi:hypothetical protein|nr:hypothetical protein [Roseobacter sp.]
MSLLLKFMRKSQPKAAIRARQPATHISAPLRQTVATVEGTSALMIACPSPTEEDRARDAHRLRGQFLARQDRWENISHEIARADRDLTATPGAMMVAELLSYGARADVVAAAEHALMDGNPPKDAPLLQGIEALEEILAEAPDDPARAVTVAHAHMDIGWSWRGTNWHEKVPTRNMDAFEAHFDRAYDILAPFEESCAQSSLYRTARAALNGSSIVSGTQVARDYEALIDLNPMNPAPMRALGNYVSPRWYGSHQELQVEAHRTAARTAPFWGTGGYTWVMFDALAGDAMACENLDTDFFIEGLQDILDRLTDQHTANTLAAFCAHTIGAHRTGNTVADAARARIAGCAHWIVRNHLTELHPLIWAHAAAGFDNGLRVPSPRRFAALGRQNALRVIATLFQNEIADGRRIIFTAEGPVAEHC